MSVFSSVTPNLIVNDVAASTRFIVTDVDGLYGAVAPQAPVAMPLKTQFYGMREFAVTDPDGHILTFAERKGE